MLSRTAGAASMNTNVNTAGTDHPDCSKLIRKRSSASNCSTKSYTSSSVASVNTLSSIESNEERNTLLYHHQKQQQQHHHIQVPVVASMNNFHSGSGGQHEYNYGLGVGGGVLGNGCVNPEIVSTMFVSSSMHSTNSGSSLNNSMCSSDPIHSYYTSSSSNRINIDKDEMKKYFNAPQVLAARMLNVSVSTLKRRYYEMYKSRWPYQRLSNSERRKSIWYYVNEEDESEKYISSESMKTLLKAFEDPTIQVTKVKPVKEKQPQSAQRQFLSYIPPSEKTKSYYDANMSQTDSPQIKGGSRQKYYLIGGKSSSKRR